MIETADLLAALRRYWGYDSFRPLQEGVVRSVLAGRLQTLLASFTALADDDTAADNGESLANRIDAATSDEDLFALDEALDKLAAQDPGKAKLVELRYFAGLTGAQAAAVLGISPTTADRHWAYARAWLRAEVLQS